MVIKTGRLQGFVVSLVCSGFIAFGRPFLDCYVGPDYWEAYWVAVVIMVPNCIPLVQSAANSVLQAKNMHSFRAKLYLVIAIVNLIGTLVLVQKYGIIGAAIPTGVAYIFGQGLIMNWYYWKKVGLDIPRFWKNLLPLFTVSGVMCVITLALSNWIDFYSWGQLFCGIACYTVIWSVCIWCFVLNQGEKTMIINMVAKIKK